MESSPSTPCRLPHSSSVLQALASLTPPSPILSPSQLPTTCTSGDIPILFLGSPIADTFLFDQSLPCSDGETLSSSGSLDSMQTAETACTFGPTHSEHANGESEFQAPTSPTSPSIFRTSRSPTCASLKLSSIPAPDSYALPGNKNRQAIYDDPVFTINTPPHTPSGSFRPSFADAPESAYYSTLLHCESVPGFRAPLSPSTNRSRPDTCSVFSHTGEDDTEGEPTLRYIPPSQTFSTLSTPSFALPSPSLLADPLQSWPSSPRSTRNFHRSFGYLSRDANCDRRGMPFEKSPRISSQTSLFLNSAPSSPPPSSFHAAASHHHLEAHVGLFSSQGPSVHDVTGSSNSVPLPEKLSWLKDVTVELYIDQEGFRAINPSFGLMGYSSKFRFLTQAASSLTDGSVEDETLEYVPTKRETFLFHYAPFDSPPILRRITVNGDESRDYIARQASLNLKSNGVYYVSGTETSALPLANTGHNPDPVKLKWKFGYMVEDRRAEATGRIIDGEKIFTPLTFSCSPLMLHSVQGKKITLMHVVRKSVIPNLAAEKLEPSKFAMRSTLSMSNLKANIQTTASHYFAKPHAWNKHQRASSHAVKHEDEENLIPKSPSGWKLKALGQLSPKAQRVIQQPRRRRASSAGEQGGGNFDKTDSDPIVSSFSRIKHIVPRSRLCEMLSEEAAEATPQYQTGFHGLTPRRPVNR